MSWNPPPPPPPNSNIPRTPSLLLEKTFGSAHACNFHSVDICIWPPPPRPQLLKYIMLKLHVQGIFIIILVYSIRFGYLWITCIYICQGFYPYRKELWSVTWCILFWFSEELSADRLYGFVAKEQGIFPGVSQDSVFPRKQRANLFYMYWKKQWD